jgi:ABC-type nitrate/sulfonate/bicarbonate transport system substrate-binding protein
VVEAVTSGKALVGLMPADLAARARADGQPLKIVGTTFQRNPLAVMSLATDSIETPMELVGKRLGVPDADRPIAEAFFRVLGIDPGSVNLTRVQFNPTPLVENKVDAFLSFVTNQPIQLAVQGIDTVTFLLADYGFNTFTDTFVVTEQTLADPAAREKVVKILRATSRGWRTAIDDTEAATERVVDWYGREYQLDLESQLLTARSQIALIETGDTRANGLLTMSDAAIAVNIETLGHAGVAIAADALFDPSLLAEVYQKGINLG